MKPDASRGLVDGPFDPKSLPSGPEFFDYSREVVLIVCFVLLLFMFAITALVARLYHKKVHTLADGWSAKGQAALHDGDVTGALTDYRNALVYSPNNPVFQLHLAQTLAAAGYLDEAASYLTNLLAESPGNAEINLELARIAARKKQTFDAIRYYHSAIYGVWDSNPLMRRASVRGELCEYLLDLGDVTDAQPEIIALAQEIPSGDLERQRKAGEFLMRAGLQDRTLDEFQSILKFDPRDQEALAGAGTAAFQLGRYPQALLYFDLLPREKKSDPAIADMMEKTHQVIEANPYGAGLSVRERAKRTSAALKQATSRIAGCAHERGESLSETPSVSDFQKLYATSVSMARDWNIANLQLHPDRIDSAMALVFRMEDTAAEQCGEPPTGPDHALWVIGRSRQGPGQ